MNDNKNKKMPTEQKNNEDLKTVDKSLAEVLTDEFKTFAQDLADFDKKFAERRSRLKNGARRRTSGRVI